MLGHLSQKIKVTSSANTASQQQGKTSQCLQLKQAKMGDEGIEQEKQRKRKLLAARRRLGKGEKIKEREKLEKETGTMKTKWSTIVQGRTAGDIKK